MYNIPTDDDAPNTPDDPDVQKSECGDVNGDGKADTGDALLVLQYVAKLIDGFPAEQ